VVDIAYTNLVSSTYRETEIGALLAIFKFGSANVGVKVPDKVPYCMQHPPIFVKSF